MKKVFLAISLIFCIVSNSIAQESETIYETIKGRGEANGGEYEYEATLMGKIFKYGGSIAVKVGIKEYKITSFLYKGENLGSYDEFSFPIIIKNIQSDLTEGAFSIKNRYSGEGFIIYQDYNLKGVRKGGLDNVELNPKNSTYYLQSNYQIENLVLDLTGGQLKNTYFEALSKIATTFDKNDKEKKQKEYLAEQKEKAQEKLKEIEIEQEREKWQKRRKELELSAEERRKVAQMTAYLNTIDKFESYGMSSSDARRFANNESKMQFQEEIISNAFKTAGNLIVDGMNRREEALSNARVYVSKYMKSIELAAKKLENYDYDYSKNLEKKFKEKYDNLNNIDDIKKAILEYVYAWDNYTFSDHIYDGNIYMDDYLIVQQKIKSAKFTEDILEVVYIQEVQKTTRDKHGEYMGYDKKSWLTFQPSKYTHKGYLFLNTETGEKNIYEGTTWKTPRGLEVLPTGNLIKTEDYRKQVKNLSLESYYKPDRPSNFGFYFGKRGGWLYSQMRKLKTLIENEKIKNINKETLAYEINSKLDIFLSLKPNTPYIIKRNENISGSTKEVSIFAFNGEDYIIYTIPDPSIVKRLFKDEINVDSPKKVTTNTRLVKYKSSKGNKEKNWFTMGNNYNNVFFGNNDLLWIGEQYTKFNDVVYYTFSKSRNGVVADLKLSKNQNKDYLNPYIETGKISKTVDYSLIKDNDLIKTLNNNNFKNKEGIPVFQIQLLRTNLSMLFSEKKGDFVMYDNAAKDTESRQKYLYFKMTNFTTHYGELKFKINNNDVNSDFYKSQVNLDEVLEEIKVSGNYDLSKMIRTNVKNAKKVESTSTSYFTSSEYRLIYEIIPSLLKTCNISTN